jgi:hypothetical protein
VTDIATRLNLLFWEMKNLGKIAAKNVIADAIDEIERLKVELADWQRTVRAWEVVAKNHSINDPILTQVSQMVDKPAKPPVPLSSNEVRRRHYSYNDLVAHSEEASLYENEQVMRMREAGDRLLICLEWAMEGRNIPEDMEDSMKVWEEIRNE